MNEKVGSLKTEVERSWGSRSLSGVKTVGW